MSCTNKNCLNTGSTVLNSQTNLQANPCSECKKVFYCSELCKLIDW